MITKIRNKYSFLGKLQLVMYIIRTKIISPKSRLIRFPITIRGKQYIKLGTNLTTGVGCRLEAFITDNKKQTKISFGQNVQINDYVHISSLASVTIGNGVLIASHVYISDNSHGKYDGTLYDTSPTIPPVEREYCVAPVVIEDNVWIGEGVIIMPGVCIGKGAIIGAHSVVNRDIPANCIAVGAPARVVKKYSFEKQIWERYTIQLEQTV